VNIQTGNIIELSNNSIDETLSHKVNKETIKSIYILGDIIENAVFVKNLDNLKINDKPHIKGYDYYMSKIRIAGNDYLVNIEVSKSAVNDKDRFYNHILSDISVLQIEKDSAPSIAYDDLNQGGLGALSESTSRHVATMGQTSDLNQRVLEALYNTPDIKMYEICQELFFEARIKEMLAGINEEDHSQNIDAHQAFMVEHDHVAKLKESLVSLQKKIEASKQETTIGKNPDGTISKQVSYDTSEATVDTIFKAIKDYQRLYNWTLNTISTELKMIKGLTAEGGQLTADSGRQMTDSETYCMMYLSEQFERLVKDIREQERSFDELVSKIFYPGLHEALQTKNDSELAQKRVGIGPSTAEIKEQRIQEIQEKIARLKKELAKIEFQRSMLERMKSGNTAFKANEIKALVKEVIGDKYNEKRGAVWNIPQAYEYLSKEYLYTKQEIQSAEKELGELGIRNEELGIGENTPSANAATPLQEGNISGSEKTAHTTQIENIQELLYEHQRNSEELVQINLDINYIYDNVLKTMNQNASYDVDETTIETLNKLQERYNIEIDINDKKGIYSLLNSIGERQRQVKDDVLISHNKLVSKAKELGLTVKKADAWDQMETNLFIADIRKQLKTFDTGADGGSVVAENATVGESLTTHAPSGVEQGVPPFPEGKGDLTVGESQTICK